MTLYFDSDHNFTPFSISLRGLSEDLRYDKNWDMKNYKGKFVQEPSRTKLKSRPEVIGKQWSLCVKGHTYGLKLQKLATQQCEYWSDVIGTSLGHDFRHGWNSSGSQNFEIVFYRYHSDSILLQYYTELKVTLLVIPPASATSASLKSPNLQNPNRQHHQVFYGSPGVRRTHLTQFPFPDSNGLHLMIFISIHQSVPESFDVSGPWSWPFREVYSMGLIFWIL
jgi:hypothetical protein